MKRREFLGAGVGASALLRAGGSLKGPEADRPAEQGAAPIIDGVSPAPLDDRYVGMLKTAGVSGWHKSMGGIDSFAAAYNFLDGRKDVAVATTAGEIRKARERGTVALLFGWQSADPLGTVSDRKDTPLRAYHQMGLRIVNLVYNVMNQFAGGNLEPDKGLTRTGRRLVEEIHRLGIVLDVGGHSGEQSSQDAIAASSGVPIICSHTNMAGLIDNPRNISDRLATAIAKTGGVIGLTAINDFNARRRQDAHVKTTPQVGLSALLDQYDYAKRLVGADHIGMGNDFTENPTGRIDPSLPQFPPEMASDQSPIGYVKGFERITELPNLVNGLRQRGWSAGDIDKAMGLNWLRVYEKVWHG